MAHLREALQYKPDFAEAHFYLGQALAALGQRDEAIAHFKEALRLNPDYRDAREQLNKLEGTAK
jgi:tetratricopeptide (TPR) repeat protein